MTQRLAYTLGISIVLALHGAAAAQQTIVIGGPKDTPGVEINFDAIYPVRPASTLQNSRTPRRQTAPDLLQPSKANMPASRAASTQALLPPGAPMPLTPRPAQPPVALKKLQPASPPPPIPAPSPPGEAKQPEFLPMSPVTAESPPPEPEQAESLPAPPVASENPPPEPEQPEFLPAPPVAAENPAETKQTEFLPAPTLLNTAEGLVVAPPEAAPPAPEKLAAVDPSAPLADAAPAADAPEALLFEPGSIEIPGQAAEQLRALAGNLQNGDDRVQLKSHAGGNEDAAKARRLSLKRALAARAVLIEAGIDATRIDVRALGPADDGGPPDRIDMIILPQ